MGKGRCKIGPTFELDRHPTTAGLLRSEGGVVAGRRSRDRDALPRRAVERPRVAEGVARSVHAAEEDELAAHGSHGGLRPPRWPGDVELLPSFAVERPRLRGPHGRL